MFDYRGEIRTRNDNKENIFCTNLDTLPEMKLNYGSIYDSEVCTALTEVNTNLNMDTFEIYLNDKFNFGSFGLSIGYPSKVERKVIYVEKLSAKWMIKLDNSKATLGTMAQLVIRSSENPSID